MARGTRGGGGPEFTRLWAPWLREAVARGASGRELAVFASIARYQTPAGDGLYKAYRPRAEIALETGLSEGQVTGAVKRLTRRGCLKPIGKAHRGGCAQTYVLMPGCPLDGEQKVGPPDPPKKAERWSPQSPKVGPPDPPNKKKNGAPDRLRAPAPPKGRRDDPVTRALAEIEGRRGGGGT